MLIFLEHVLDRQSQQQVPELNEKNTYRNKQVGHLSFILSPRLAVLVAATLDVTKSTVADHAREEERVEPRERAAKARDKTPVQGKVEIASVMDLASLAICENVSFQVLSQTKGKTTYTTHQPESGSHRPQ